MRTLAYRVLHPVLIIMMVLLSGCGMFRKVFKSKDYSSLETKSEIKKDSIGLIIDKSVTTIKERIDTVITTPEKVVKQGTYFNMDSLVNGITAIKNEVMDLRLVLNPATGILSAEATIKAFKIPVHLDKETIKQNDVTQRSRVNENKRESLEHRSGSTIIEKQPISIKYYLAGLLLIIVVSVFFWIKRKTD